MSIPFELNQTKIYKLKSKLTVLFLCRNVLKQH